MQQLYQPFVRPGLIDNDCSSPLCLSSILQIYDQLPLSIRNLRHPINHVVTLGDSRSLPVNLEVPLTLAIPDSLRNIHAHSLYYSVLYFLSHDAILGLVDLIGPYYDLFEDSILFSRKLAASNFLITYIDDISTAVTAITTSVPQQHQLDLSSLVQHKQNYRDRKISICPSSLTTFDSLDLQDGSSVQVLSHLTYGTVYVEDSIEQRYESLTQPQVRDSYNNTKQQYSYNTLLFTANRYCRSRRIRHT